MVVSGVAHAGDTGGTHASDPAPDPLVMASTRFGVALLAATLLAAPLYYLAAGDPLGDRGPPTLHAPMAWWPVIAGALFLVFGAARRLRMRSRSMESPSPGTAKRDGRTVGVFDGARLARYAGLAAGLVGVLYGLVLPIRWMESGPGGIGDALVSTPDPLFWTGLWLLGIEGGRQAFRLWVGAR